MYYLQVPMTHWIKYIFKYKFCCLVPNPIIWTNIIYFGSCVWLIHTLFFLPQPHHAHRRQWWWARYVFFSISYWCLRAWPTQDDKSPPPCMRLQAGVAVVLTYPPPRLYMRAGVGFSHPMWTHSRHTGWRKPTPLHATASRGGCCSHLPTPSLVHASRGGFFPSNVNPPTPLLAIARRGGTFGPFFG